jgi:hypothetical protein
MNSALRAVSSLAVLALGVGCQTYDFEPVTPLAIAQTTQTKTVTAKQLKPNLMMLIDKSGSMNDGENSMVPVSGTNPRKMDTLKNVMGTFLSSQGRVARMGMTIYPQGTVCDAAGANEVRNPISVPSDSDADLQAQASAINTNIQTLVPGGGTPTALSLQFVGSLPELNDPQREDFVLLLTDGLPNCNPNNQNNCNAGNCQCTVNPQSACGVGQPYCTLGCLDTDGSVQAIRDLRMRGIRTIVVGFGSDVAGGAAGNTLNAMAIAGGFQRTCPNRTDAECGTGNTCDMVQLVCARAYYQASNGTELAAALAQISDNLAGDSICRYTLEATPSRGDLVSVIIDGVPQPQGTDTWDLMAGAIIMQGALCDKLKASTTTNPVQVEIRIVQSL